LIKISGKGLTSLDDVTSYFGKNGKLTNNFITEDKQKYLIGIPPDEGIQEESIANTTIEEDNLTEQSLVLQQASYLVKRYNSIQYTYDAVGNRLSLTQDNEETLHYSYNAANQLLQTGDTSFTYDDNGNQLSKTNSEGVVEYSYDGRNRLVEAAFEDGSYAKYEYDAMGRKISREELTFQSLDLTDPEKEKSNKGKAKGKNDINPGNGNGKPEQADGKSNGNANEKSNGQANGNAKGQVNQDCEKQVPSNGSQKGDNKGQNENALNNGNGNKFGLLKQLENDKGALGKPNLEQTRYLYEGLSTVLHKEYSEKGSPYAEYYTGPNSEVVSRKMFGLHGLVNPGHEDTLDTNGGLMYYQYNGRHTVSELTDRQGSMVESYRYDTFGSMYSGITAPYNTASYTGHHFDNMTGLMDMKARWYDPTSARFLTNTDTSCT
jgi:YD repeat-containing protein